MLITLVFWVLLNSAGTESRLSLFPLLSPTKQIIWDWLKHWAGTQGGQRDIAYSITLRSAIKTGVQEEKERGLASRVAIARGQAWHQSACRRW